MRYKYMSKRKPITVLGAVAGILALFSVLVFICYFARNFGMANFGKEMINAIQNAFSHFGKFEQADLPYSIGIIAVSVISGIVLLVWLIAGIKRKRFICFYGILLLAISWVITIVNLSLSRTLFDHLTSGSFAPMDVVTYFLGMITFVTVIVFHIVDMVKNGSKQLSL